MARWSHAPSNLEEVTTITAQNRPIAETRFSGHARVPPAQASAYVATEAFALC